MAYRFRDPSPTFDNLLGTRTAPGGSWHFYELGTSSPKATFQDYDLTTPNTNPIVLTASSRFPVPVWLDGDYTVELKAADGSSIINPTDIRPEIAPGLAIPDPLGHEGEYLTNDGSVAQWSGPIWNLPDPSGSAGDLVQVNSDGTGYILAPPPTIEVPDPEIVVTPTTFQAGISDNEVKYYQMSGTGSAPASGTKTTQVAVVFPGGFTFDTAPVVIPMPTIAAAGSGGFLVTVSVIAKSPTGFTVKFDTNEGGGSSSSSNIINPITFDWIATGRKTVP